MAETETSESMITSPNEKGWIDDDPAFSCYLARL